MKRMVAGTVPVLLVVGSWSAPASAHVTINTLGVVTQGSFAKVGFSVPNERDDAGTVKLRVQFPPDHPLAFVSVQPMPGWDIVTTTRTLDPPVQLEGSTISEAIDTVTWTAAGGTQIAAGQFELFWVSAGQMPTDVAALSFPAIQTYSSGEEVAWIDQATAGGPEPEHPAPTLQLATATDPASPVALTPSSNDDGSGNTLSIIAIVIGTLGLLAGGLALVRSRRRGPAAAA